MKNTFCYLVICSLLILAAYSCKRGYRGGWERVKLDKYEVSVGLEGGEDIITIANNPVVFIKGIRSLDQEGTSSDGIDVISEDSKIYIRVSASETQRSWKILVDYYDAFCEPIFVYQK